ncbi:hypothetical protein [Pseudoalteromonas sp. MMG022]|uniref:hypothetical protein n=1 Tax=Pseudoalteromonas sp. MMG022 TaxID=2909978 RepID=UPI001F42A4B9|nr:hypothetical protein [Pseudoalteromonas sp. MMG022]MCF6435227.1 hypothetical protein [Pseudoalteromonas sp. MMG022]
MTIEAQLAQLQQAAAEQTDASLKLASDVTDSINEIDQVKVDINQTHELIKSNHQAINDWQTKTGKVTLKDFNGQSYQVDTLPSLIGEAQKINPHPEVMSKAQFDALRKLRKQQFSGSGFVQWGQHWASAGAHRVVNQGMWEQTNGVLYMGINSSSTGQGESTTKYPVAVVDGVELRLDYVARNTNWCDIRFPPAPDGTKTYDSATGQVTQHASAAEAFEGLISNGNFRNELDNWEVKSATALLTQEEVTITATAEFPSLSQVIELSEGETIRIQFNGCRATNGKQYRIIVGTGLGSGNELVSDATVHNTVEVEYTAKRTGLHYIGLQGVSLSTGDEISFRSCSVFEITKQVIISRKDLVFLESWHEKIADKDVVYPLGNVQFGASTYQDVPLLNNLVAQGYSAFGQWDTSTKGFGVKWSTLSAANRVKFLKNPEHNIYYDPEAKAYFQVRYRIRVEEGCGAPWKGQLSVGAVVDSSVIRDVYPHCLRLQGSLAAVEAIGPDNSMLAYTGVSKHRDKDTGTWGKRSHCQAIPIALVQRLNQGAYHPTYNSMGTGKRRISGGYYYHWFETHNALTEISSTFDCFDMTANNGGGNIGPNCGWANIATGASHSGRVDQYVFYDAIYAGQVEDLRLNANKLDINQLREAALSKAVAGALRGQEQIYFTKVNPTVNIDISQRTIVASETYPKLKAILQTTQFYNSSRPVISPVEFDEYHVFNVTQGWISTIGKDTYPVVFSEASAGPGHIYFAADKPISSNDMIQIVFSKKLSGEFDSLPWVDIVGHPERIAATFPDGVVGKWLPKLPDNSSGYPLNRKMVGSTLNATYTRDLGASWTNSNVGFDSVKNTSSGSWNPDIVALLSYQALANNTHAQSLKPVIGDVSNVYATQAHRIDYGNRLQHSLNNTVGTRADSPYFQEELAILKSGKHYPSGKLTWTNRAGDEPKHFQLSLDSQEEPSSAIKTLSALVERGGLLYLQFNGAELKYHKQQVVDMSESSTELKTAYGVYRVIDGPLKGKLLKRIHSTGTSVPFNDADWSIDEVGLKYQTNTDYSFKFFKESFNWGDDQTIPIIDGENIKTDLNGNTVKVFCHHTQLPLGIASH